MMKPKVKIPKRSRRVLLVILACLTFTPLAQAFYNPNSGRWLSRDPIEEKGGNHLTAFVLNRPTMLHDAVGLTFDWGTPTFHTVPREIPDLDNPGWNFGGMTDWKTFSPSVSVWRSTSCACDYQITVFGSAQVHYWYVLGSEKFRLHELDHVNLHYKPAYESFKENAESYQGTCMSKAKATCIKGVIEGKMKQTYMHQAATMGAEYDCLDYGDGDPASEPCRRKNEHVMLYLVFLAEMQSEIDACNKL